MPVSGLVRCLDVSTAGLVTIGYVGKMIFLLLIDSFLIGGSGCGASLFRIF